jgi:hypothetical protein
MLERREAAPARKHPERHAHCPLCGEERADQLLRDLTSAEDALCPHPCAAAWRTLAALRRRESVNEALASRRRLEYEAGQPFAPLFSDLLLGRWRAGDWTLMPQDLLARLEAAGDGEDFKTLAERAKREYAPEQEPKDAHASKVTLSQSSRRSPARKRNSSSSSRAR